MSSLRPQGVFAAPVPNATTTRVAPEPDAHRSEGFSFARYLLLIDVDGVLVRAAPGTSWQDGLKQDLGLDPSVLQSCFFDVHWADIMRGRADLFARLSSTLEEWGSEVTAGDLADYWFKHDAELDHRLLSILSDARRAGHAAHIVTNQEHHRARYLWEDLELRQAFEEIHYSAAIGRAKPDPEFFAFLESDIPDFEAMTPLLIDDQLCNVEAATAMGWQAIHWTDPSRSAGELIRRLEAR
jgi:putative hydrolase of the HAD superfamily